MQLQDIPWSEHCPLLSRTRKMSVIPDITTKASWLLSPNHVYKH